MSSSKHAGGNSIMAEREDVTPKMPDLANWQPTYRQIYYMFDGDVVTANYEQHVGLLPEDRCSLPTFYIKKTHYKKKMLDIVHHMNFFTTFYDLDKDTYFAILTTKYQVDTHPDMKEAEFLEMLLGRIVNDEFIAKCKQMARDLYTINIDTDSEGKFKNSPKISNAQARQIVAVSFCFRIILPICIHFANVSTSYTEDQLKYQYLDGFSDIFLKIIKKFERNDIKFFSTLCRFVWIRVVNLYKNNQKTFEQKAMIRGETAELLCDRLIREIISVKTIYKLDYHRPCVAFIDGVVRIYEHNFVIENYPSKPYEIDSPDTAKDSDESLSHAEALEMASYNRDASSIMISDCNRKAVMKNIDAWYSSFNVSEEELEFYMTHCKLNPINLWMLNSFYSEKFKDSYATLATNRADTIRLLIYLKKYLEYHKMPILAQVTTANIFGKYKVNVAKNSKFLERFYASNVFQRIIADKYQYIGDLGMKENPIIQRLGNIISCAFEFVDFNEEINGQTVDDMAMDEVGTEFQLFLSIT